MTMLKKHKIYYAAIVLVCGFGVFLLLQKGLSLQIKYLIAVLLSLFYIIWGITHHSINHTPSVKIVLEYTLVGTLGFLLITLLLQSL